MDKGKEEEVCTNLNNTPLFGFSLDIMKNIRIKQ